MLHHDNPHHGSQSVCLQYYATIMFLWVSMLLPLSSFADIYRCVNEKGIVVYSDQPCGDNAAVAFKESGMSVDDAISRKVIHMTALRDRLSLFESDVERHAKTIGGCILPDIRLHEVRMNHIGKNAFNRDWN